MRRRDPGTRTGPLPSFRWMWACECSMIDGDLRSRFAMNRHDAWATRMERLAKTTHNPAISDSVPSRRQFTLGDHTDDASCQWKSFCNPVPGTDCGTGKPLPGSPRGLVLNINLWRSRWHVKMLPRSPRDRKPRNLIRWTL